MPEIIEHYEFKPPPTSYPWEEWLQDGVTRRYQKGVDFHTTSRVFASTIRTAAWRLGWQLRIERDHNSVTAMPYPREDEGWQKTLRERDAQLRTASQDLEETT